MTTVAVTSVDSRNARRYMEAIEGPGLEARLLLPQHAGSKPAEALMEGVGGYLLTGGPDVDPALYGALRDPSAGSETCRLLDDLELRLLAYALDRDMPVLAICRGMQLLNVAFGGQLIQDLAGHRTEQIEGRWVSKTHLVYLAPGSKTAAIIGMAGFFRLNSRHHQGLHEAQRSPRLMSSAYGVEDGLIEGLESPEHNWVIGLQCHPERQDEVPRIFANVFAAFGDRAAKYAETQRAPSGESQPAGD